MNKENLNKLWEITKKVINYAFLLIVLGTGFYIGKMYTEYFPEDEEDQPTSSSDVSIAIDDQNRIFIIDKDSGEYQVLSDSVGVTIFKMYASRIYNTQPK
jgi:hypothetical protein